jgi:hypothetical protein
MQGRVYLEDSARVGDDHWGSRRLRYYSIIQWMICWKMINDSQHKQLQFKDINEIHKKIQMCSRIGDDSAESKKLSLYKQYCDSPADIRSYFPGPSVFQT